MDMHLSIYLKQNSLSQATFGEQIGVSQAAVERYANKKRVPEPDVMGKIFEVTNGLVTANDFYDLLAPPDQPGIKRRKRGVQ